LRNIYKTFEIIFKNIKLFSKIILEQKGVKSNYLLKDLELF